MGMREECKHFQSRTYKSGRGGTVLHTRSTPPISLGPARRTVLPMNARLVDVGWSHGSLVDRPVEAAPPDVPAEDRRSILESASEIMNAVAPDLIEERRKYLEEEGEKEPSRLEVLAALVAVKDRRAPFNERGHGLAQVVALQVHRVPARDEVQSLFDGSPVVRGEHGLGALNRER